MRPALPRAVIFDMDGVLTDSEPLINSAAVAMFTELGLEVRPEDFHPFVGTGENRYLGGVAEKYQYSLDIPSAKKRTYEIYLQLVPEKLHAFPGAVDLVRACRVAGFRVALASSADRIKIDANLHKIGLPPADWDAIVTGDDVEHKKPAPDIFLAAARKLGFAPSDCTVVEDAVNGVEAAKAAGMRCVAVAQSFPAERLRGADVVRPAIADVALDDLGSVPVAEAAPGPPPPRPADTVPPAPGREESAPGPWGLLATILLSFAVAVVFVLAQGIAGIAALFAAEHFGLGPVESADALQNQGWYWSVAILVATPVTVGFVVLFAALRQGYSVRQYLALRPVRWSTLVRWSLGLIALAIASDGLTWTLGRPIVPDVMLEAYRSALVPPILWLALLLGAPLTEECFFRGFLFRGLQVTRLGGPATVLVTSALWAGIHLQYDWFGIAIVFAIGLFIGAARLLTDSLYPCLAMHALMNLIATLQTAFASV